jgi:hypothetical protein
MHFRKQDWIAIGLDFIIVVVGIFVGLQVSQWNDDRQDRVLEQQYLQSLKSDFESDIDELDDAIERARSRAQLFRSIQSAIAAQHVGGDPNDFIWAVFNTNLLNYPVYTRTTINDLLSTGNLQLVQDNELKKAIADYYADIEYKEQWTTNWRDMQIAMEHTHPDLLEFRIREAGQLRYIGGPEWVTEPFEFDSQTAEDVLQKIIGHPFAKGQIENMTRIQDSHYRNLTLVRQNAVALVNSLDVLAKP